MLIINNLESYKNKNDHTYIYIYMYMAMAMAIDMEPSTKTWKKHRIKYEDYSKESGCH